ncbi:MAG: peptidoglycan-binding protein [Opitutus sp.]|nr:peptidoglycan-binding protein [Opitutus sp.]
MRPADPNSAGTRLRPSSVLAPIVREAAPEISSPAPEVDAQPVSASGPLGPPVDSWLDAQVELARRGFSSGSIDGVAGPKTRAALRAFQASRNLPTTGELDAITRLQLVLSASSVARCTLAVEERAELQPLQPT